MGRRRHRAAAAAARGDAEVLAVAGAADTTADADADANAHQETPTKQRPPSSPPSSRRLALHVPGESDKLSTRAGAVSPGFNGSPGSPLMGGGPGERRIELMQRLARRLLDDLEALLPPSRPASRMSEYATASLTLTL
jgi:hypothetical protein